MSSKARRCGPRKMARSKASAATASEPQSAEAIEPRRPKTGWAPSSSASSASRSTADTWAEASPRKGSSAAPPKSSRGTPTPREQAATPAPESLRIAESVAASDRATTPRDCSRGGTHGAAYARPSSVATSCSYAPASVAEPESEACSSRRSGRQPIGPSARSAVSAGRSSCGSAWTRGAEEAATPRDPTPSRPPRCSTATPTPRLQPLAQRHLASEVSESEPRSRSSALRYSPGRPETSEYYCSTESALPTRPATVEFGVRPQKGRSMHSHAELLLPSQIAMSSEYRHWPPQWTLS